MKFEFVGEVGKGRQNSKIKVVGVGGAGGNAVNNMINSDLKCVDYIVANTDSQDLNASRCPNKIQLGPSNTKGYGSGGDPDIGKISAEESIKEVRDQVQGCSIVFIAAGMGGGTGTGAAPVIAKECKDIGALTIGIVTTPFEIEGKRRMKKALDGIEALKEEVDSIIIVPNEKLKNMSGQSVALKDIFSMADDILFKSVKGITDLIMGHGYINLDFADIKKIMENMGHTVMGVGRASDEGRGLKAAQMAIQSPLLDDYPLKGAVSLLVNITGPEDMTMNEVDSACSFIKDQASDDAEMFLGVVYDQSYKNEIQITVIATGIEKRKKSRRSEFSNVINIHDKVRDVTVEDTSEPWDVRINGVSMDEPTFLRRSSEQLDAESKTNVNSGKKGLLSKLSLKDNLDIPAFMRSRRGHHPVTDSI